MNRHISDLDVRAVLFDWGDTLIRPPGITTNPDGHFRCVEAFYHDEFLATVTANGHTAPDWPEFRRLYEEATMEHVRQTLSTGREHSFAGRIASTATLAGNPDMVTANQCGELGDALGRYIARDSIPLAGAREVVHHLSATMHTGLLSNYPHAAAVRESLEQAGILAHLHEVIISSEIGWSKPSPTAFTKAIEALAVEPAEILFVGDDLETDMRGAKSMGMHTAWLPRAEQEGMDLKPWAGLIDLRLESIRDLADLQASHA